MKHKNKQKDNIWQDIKPVSKPRTAFQKIIFKIKRKKEYKKIQKINNLKKTIRQNQRNKIIQNSISSPKKLKKISLFRKRKLFFIAILILLISCVGFIVFKPKPNTAINTEKIDNQPDKPVAAKPNFKTIIPESKKNESLNWVRISPSNTAPVYAFIDKIDEVSINVSEQLLPEDFESNTDEQLKDLAKNFKATEKLSVEDYTIYIGTSIEGPQSVIFSKNNLLILIKSNNKIDNNSWVQYINSMK